MVENVRKVGEPHCNAESNDDWMERGRNESNREKGRDRLVAWTAVKTEREVANEERAVIGRPLL